MNVYESTLAHEIHASSRGVLTFMEAISVPLHNEFGIGAARDEVFVKVFTRDTGFANHVITTVARGTFQTLSLRGDPSAATLTTTTWGSSDWARQNEMYIFEGSLRDVRLLCDEAREFKDYESSPTERAIRAHSTDDVERAGEIMAHMFQARGSSGEPPAPELTWDAALPALPPPDDVEATPQRRMRRG